MTTDREAVWIPLLQGLTRAAPGWTVWKNVDSALHGEGDVDAAAPRHQWPILQRIFRGWAQEAGLSPVVICRHIPGGINMVALPDNNEPFFELGMKDRRIWRGATLFRAPDLEGLLELDPRGFRTVRPGAEGLFKLLLNGVTRGGAPDHAALVKKGVADLLRKDPDGVTLAARLLGPVRAAGIAAAEAVTEGRWDRRAAALIEAWFLTKAVTQPHVSLPRAYFKLRGRNQCPVVSAILSENRRVDGEPIEWARSVSREHVVYGL